MPRWLKIMLLAAGVVIGLVFLAELLLVARRHQQARLRASKPGAPLPANAARIVMADYDRVVVTFSKPDDTIVVLRPPGEDPKAVLRAARLVLPEGPYGELADQLGEPASWPME